MRKKEDIETIYDAALRVFAEYGYRKTTVEEIAGELGMTKGNIYRYVKDKKDLYDKAVAHALLRWQSLVGDALRRETDVQRQFTVMCTKAVEYLSRDRHLRRILIRDPDIFPLLDEHDPYRKINRASEAMLNSIITRGIEEGRFRKMDPESASRALFSIYKLLIIRTYIKSEGSKMKRVFDGTLDLITRGLFK
jgi:AcrR family transcriptional regulator